MKNLQLLTALFLLLFLGCSQTDNIDPDDDTLGGSFQVSISGDMSQSMKGEAAFLHGILTTKSDQENGSTLAITLFDENDQDNFITITIGQPGDLDGVNTGKYTIDLDAEDTDPLVNVAAFFKSSTTLLLGMSGEATLSKIQNGNVEGKLSATLDDQNGIVINISGDFTAIGFTKNI